MLEYLCNETGTNPEDWEDIDGPTTGVGVERWFRHKEDGREVYLCDDQGDISISQAH